MNGQDIVGFLAAEFGKVIVLAVLAGVAVTLGALYGVPYLWNLVKPFLHSITA